MDVIVDPLRTTRLVLTPVRPDDVDAIFQVARTPESIEDYQRAASTPADVAEWLLPTIDGRDAAWTIRADDVVIGLVSLEPDDSWAAAATAELGYFVDVGHSGRGVATEAATAAVDWAWSATSIERITAGVTVRNPASLRVLEKLGFDHVRTVPDDWEWDGQRFDSAYYELARPD
ncbi:MAG: GNAT family N-acetyltransferase [Actinomycetota bacterium]